MSTDTYDHFVLHTRVDQPVGTSLPPQPSFYNHLAPSKPMSIYSTLESGTVSPQLSTPGVYGFPTSPPSGVEAWSTSGHRYDYPHTQVRDEPHTGYDYPNTQARDEPHTGYDYPNAQERDEPHTGYDYPNSQERDESKASIQRQYDVPSAPKVLTLRTSNASSTT
ncbi:uncharacterized protein MONBRDRAFT_6243 [Monosiga brevicollis MX1]|uniref:Uncharacterized protein n=1 Tax=Monosiga brevicollis TaxID=81824 RepID=A9UT90_MONBE|nr:uncharacterized protein MONBRDRAFT_6243 [Monosiga brevicollis MX1]EDQ91205.1 predicted protein [Monosiga brevicollis MX1]|eukprot:XP_001743627.1 hypothetical protein [Monosiga brevicollis MX1]